MLRLIKYQMFLDENLLHSYLLVLPHYLRVDFAHSFLVILATLFLIYASVTSLFGI